MTTKIDFEKFVEMVSKIVFDKLEEKYLRDMLSRITMLEKRVEKLEYKVEKILQILERATKKKKVNDALKAFIGDIAEFRPNNHVIVRHGVIYVDEDAVEKLNINLNAIEENGNCYVIEDWIEGRKFYGIMPKEALKEDEEESRKALIKWYSKYGKFILRPLFSTIS